MFSFNKLFFFSFLILSFSAQADLPRITEIRPFFPLIAGSRTVTEATMNGDGFFPSSTLSELRGQVQLNYRRVYPTLGPWQTASFDRGTGDNRSVEISSIGDNSLQFAMFENIVMRPGVWTFTFCVLGSGCSNSFELTVFAPDAASTIADTSKDVPAGKSYALNIKMEKLGTYDPKLILGDKRVAGRGFINESRVHFDVPATFFNTPGIHNVAVFDKTVGVNSNSLLVLAFGEPRLNGSPAPIVQDIFIGKNPKDAVVDLSFVPFTNPFEILITDSKGVSHIVAVPRDLLTNKMKLAIPGSWLKFGDSTLQLTLRNIAGNSPLINIPVKVTPVIIRPRPPR